MATPANPNPFVFGLTAQGFVTGPTQSWEQKYIAVYDNWLEEQKKVEKIQGQFDSLLEKYLVIIRAHQAKSPEEFELAVEGLIEERLQQLIDFDEQGLKPIDRALSKIVKQAIDSDRALLLETNDVFVLQEVEKRLHQAKDKPIAQPRGDRKEKRDGDRAQNMATPGMMTNPDEDKEFCINRLQIQLNEAIEKEERATANFDALQIQITKTEATVEAEKKKTEDEKAKVEAAKKQEEELQKHIRDIEAKLSTANSELTTRDATISRLEAEKSRLIGKNTDLEKQQKKIREDGTRDNQTLIDIRRQLEDATAQLVAIGADNEALTTENARIATLERELADEKNFSRSLATQIDKVRDEMPQFDLRPDAFDAPEGTEHERTLGDELGEHSQGLSGVASTAAGSERASLPSEDGDDELEALRTEMAERQAEIERLQAEKDDQEATLARLQSEQDDLESLVERLQTEKMVQDVDLQRLQTERNAQAAEIKRLQAEAAAHPPRPQTPLQDQPADEERPAPAPAPAPAPEVGYVMVPEARYVQARSGVSSHNPIACWTSVERDAVILAVSGAAYVGSLVTGWFRGTPLVAPVNHHRDNANDVGQAVVMTSLAGSKIARGPVQSQAQGLNPGELDLNSLVPPLDHQESDTRVPFARGDGATNGTSLPQRPSMMMATTGPAGGINLNNLPPLLDSLPRINPDDIPPLPENPDDHRRPLPHGDANRPTGIFPSHVSGGPLPSPPPEENFFQDMFRTDRTRAELPNTQRLFSLFVHLIFYIIVYLVYCAWRDGNPWLTANEHSRALMQSINGYRYGGYGQSCFHFYMSEDWAAWLDRVIYLLFNWVGAQIETYPMAG